MNLVQQILKSEGFSPSKFTAAAWCDAPKYATYKMVKGHCCSTRGQVQTPNTIQDGSLKVHDLRP